MSIDRVDWHYNTADEFYRARNHISDDIDLTDEQYDEVCLFAADHIGLFIEWIIKNGFQGEESDDEGVDLVRSGEISGARYLLDYCDGKFWDSDICDDIKPFVAEYYESDDDNRPYQYMKDYAQAVGDDNIYEIISGKKEYEALKPLIDRAYNAVGKREK